MNDEQRAEVVELLRCAADCAQSSPCTAFNDTRGDLWGAVSSFAWAAEMAVGRTPDGHDPTPESYSQPDRVFRLLEAAQRVEDGSWP